MRGASSVELQGIHWIMLVYGEYAGQRCRFPGCARAPSIRLVVRYPAKPALSWRAPDSRDRTPYYCATHDREARQHLAMLVKRGRAEE